MAKKTASVHACLLALASLSAGVHAAPAPTTLTEWQQPEVVAVNREPMKATFFKTGSVGKKLYN